jgi:NAD+ synthase
VKKYRASPDLIRRLAVASRIEPAMEVRNRVAFIRAYLVASRQRSLWLAVSGGVDSALTGRLCSIAVAAANRDGGAYRLVAVRLPYGTQRDAADADRVVRWIEPSEVVEISIRKAVTAIETLLPKSHLEAVSEATRDYARGNTKARMRMVVQYHLANLGGGLVVGTDHSAEALVGFFTKFGDGGVDVCPLFGLSKRQVRQLATHLGAPETIVNKAPTADLEDLRPGLPDEEALGISYQAIDDYLEGLSVPTEVVERIEALYRATEHKRRTPVVPQDTWWR